MTKYSLFSIFILISTVFTHAQTSSWTLKQCIDTALNNNLTIQQSSNTIDINALYLKQDKGKLFPTLNGSASETFGSGRTLNPSNYQFVNDNVWSTNISLNSSVTLFNGLQNSNSIKQSQLNYESAQYDMESRENDITIAVVNAYLQVLYAKEQIKNSEKQFEAITLQMEHTKALVEIGLKPESDLLQLKAQLAGDNVSLVKARGQLKSVKINLQQQMNIAVSSSFDIAYSEIPEAQPVLLEEVDDIYSTALSFQPIIKSYQLKSQSAAYGIKIAKGAVYPTLSLRGGIGSFYSSATKYNDVTYLNSIQQIGFLQSDPNEAVNGIITSPVYDSRNYPFFDQLNDYKNYSLSLSLSIPIFNGFQVRYNIQRQKLYFQNTLLEEQNVKNNLRKNIEQAYIDVENADASIDATQQQMDAALVSYENSQGRYENGLINITDVLIEKNKYFTAESQHLQAKYELIFRMKMLDYYKGVPIDL